MARTRSRGRHRARRREIVPVPKPQHRTKIARRQDALQRRREHYGGAESWEALKLLVFQRDRWRCLYPGCTADHLKNGVGLDCAHLRSVGMGGRRVGSEGAIDHPMWLATLCRYHHRVVDQQGGGYAVKQQIMAHLRAKFGYGY